MSLAAAYMPVYKDVPVAFTGPTSSGTATVHYIEAGSASSPTLLLLHGFPSSSYQFRDVIGMLADSYHVVAPDLAGFGLTIVPDDFDYTFDNLATVNTAWVQKLGLKDFAMYIFDYGAPVGLRYALANPTNVKAIISQNGNAFKEGFGQDFWAPIFNLWETSNSPAARQVLQDNILTLDTTKYQYVMGVPEQDLHLIDPESWHLDYLQNIAGPANAAHQLDLFYDYRNNVEMYPKFQKYLQESGVPVLAIWGKHDPAFIAAGAEAYRQGSANTVVHLVDAGHFALTTKRWEIVVMIKGWLTRFGFSG